MTEKGVQYVAKTTADLSQAQIERLKEVFPECVSEGQVNPDLLLATLGHVDALIGDEAYSFTWAGKQDAFRAIQTPSAASLMPVPDESLNWDTTQHIFVEGENLEVLKLLYKSYFGKVKMIYIDPPYNTGNDFIYRDDYSQPRRAYLEKTGQMDAQGNVLTSNPETSGRYHSAWLSMMYPRLFLARQLLRDDGAIFVSIDDNEVHNLRLLMNEVFGEENFVTQIEWQKRYTRSNNTIGFTSVVEHILLYQRTDAFAPNLFERDEEADARYSNPDNDPRGPWKAIPFLNPLSPEERPNLCYEIVNPFSGERILPEKKAWRSERSVYEQHVRDKRVWWGKDGTAKTPSIKLFLSEARGMTPINLWDYHFAGHTDLANREIKHLFDDYKVFDTPKPTSLIKRMLQVATQATARDIVLDFFAGACPTAHAVLYQNRSDGGDRRFICIQIREPTPDNSVARTRGYGDVARVGKDRIRRAIAQIEADDQHKLDLRPDEDLGFKVFKLAPSTFRQWEPPEGDGADALEHQLSYFDHGLAEGVDRNHVIYEVILKEGYSLNVRIEPLDVETNQVYRVSEPEGAEEARFFYICLDNRVQDATLNALPLDKETLFVCLDTALSDSQKVNLAMQCLLKVI
jgi:adenine-specific DNA-methyltransferase